MLQSVVGRMEKKNGGKREKFAPTTTEQQDLHNADHQLTGVYDQEALQHHLSVNHHEIGSHLYHKGFLTGFLSDITVQAFDQAYHLHRIILIRSPFFESMLMPISSPQVPVRNDTTATNTAPSNASMGAHIDLPITDPNITQEALSICFAYLYGAPIYSHIKFSNVHHVLAGASYMQLTSLCQLCVEFIVKTMGSDTVIASIGFLTCGQNYQPYADTIREACVQLMAVDLPKSLNAFNRNEQGQRELMDVYTKLPFEWLKYLLEERLSTPTEFEKYQFAKRVIEKRKVLAAGAASNGHLPSAQRLPFHTRHLVSAQSTGGEDTKQQVNENVVLLFDSDAKGRVSVMEHFAKKPYMKHQVPRKNY